MAWRRRCFTAVLLLLAVANGYGIVLGLTQREALLARWPRLETVWPLYLLCPVATLVALAALWRRRRWGLWAALAIAAVVLALELYAAGPAPHVARVPIAAALLAAACAGVWRDLR